MDLNPPADQGRRRFGRGFTALYPVATVLFAAAWFSPAVAQQPAVPPVGELRPPAEGAEKIVIKDLQAYLIPPERLRERGFKVPDIPRERNAFWVYLEAINKSTDAPQELQEALSEALRTGQWPEGENGEKLLAWLDQNQEAMELVRKAAAMPDYCMPMMSSDGRDVPIIAVLLPPLAPERQLAKMLALEAMYQQLQGQTDAGIEDYLTIQRMANHIADGNTLIEGLVGIATGSLAQAGLIRVAESGEASAETLKAATAEMERLQAAFPTWEQMVAAEQRFAQAAVDEITDSPNGFQVMMSGFMWSPPPFETSGWAELAKRLRQLYFPDRLIKKGFTEHYKMLAQAGKQREDGSIITINEEELFKQIPAWNVPGRVLLPSLSRANELSITNRANLERARLSLATAAYRADHGEAPPTLAALVPQYVASIPPDPMTGYEFEYQPSKDAKSGHTGLERVTRDNEEEYKKKRKAPAILNPRTSRWRRYVQSFCERYELTNAQRAAAEAVLRDMEGRAAQYEQTHVAKLRELIQTGGSDELTKSMGPLDQMFKELQQRLESLPDSKQQAAAQNRAAEAPPQ